MKLLVIAIYALLQMALVLFAETPFEGMIKFHPLAKVENRIIGEVVECTPLIIQNSRFESKYVIGKHHEIARLVAVHELSWTAFPESERENGTRNAIALHGKVRNDLVGIHGKASEFDVPDFEDGTFRKRKMIAWKDAKCVLVLTVMTSSGNAMVQLEYLSLDEFSSDLGADLAEYILPKLETHAGKLTTSNIAPKEEGDKRQDDPQVEGEE